MSKTKAGPNIQDRALLALNFKNARNSLSQAVRLNRVVYMDCSHSDSIKIGQAERVESLCLVCGFATMPGREPIPSSRPTTPSEFRRSWRELDVPIFYTPGKIENLTQS